MKREISELKKLYSITDAWRDLNLPGQPGKTCRSPFPNEHRHGDRNPSFSVYDEGLKFKNFATGETGDVFDLVAKVKGFGNPEAIQWVEQRIAKPVIKTNRIAGDKEPDLLRLGEPEELQQLAGQRGFSVESLQFLEQQGFLRFGKLWKKPMWCLRDKRQMLIEYRRLDGSPWQSKRKAHCTGTGKNWPLGILEAHNHDTIVLVEGAPDFLAAHHFASVENKLSSLGIVAVLGAANRLSKETLKYFKGKTVWIYPHVDDAGHKASMEWARQIKQAGATQVLGFDLTGITRTDGTPGKDLADVALIDADCFEENEKFKEVLPNKSSHSDRAGVFEFASSIECAAAETSSPLIPAYSIGEILDYKAPENLCLVGDFHIQRGAPTLLVGHPGCGKSRATLWLAVQGAKGEGSWFGHPVHHRFKTLILQSENGMNRLHRDLKTIPGIEKYEDSIRITAFDSYAGFQFDQPDFRDELGRLLEGFQPDLVVIDPWNHIARDSREADFQEAMAKLKECLGYANNPACLIVHHFRKPKDENKAHGRSQAFHAAGSYVLVSMARCVIGMNAASDDTEDAKVVVTVSKNNDGKHGADSAWTRYAGWFEPVPDFDLDAYYKGNQNKTPRVTLDHLKQIFDEGKTTLSKSEAAEKIQEAAKVGRSTAYNYLSLDGVYAEHLEFNESDQKLHLNLFIKD